MPVYEYKCSGCEKVFEVVQKFSDEPLKVCPGCGGKLGKLISNTSFVLKGTGWYLTDYARAGKDKPAATAGKAGAGGDSAGGGNGSKAEKKSEEPSKP